MAYYEIHEVRRGLNRKFRVWIKDDEVYATGPLTLEELRLDALVRELDRSVGLTMVEYVGLNADQFPRHTKKVQGWHKQKPRKHQTPRRRAVNAARLREVQGGDICVAREGDTITITIKLAKEAS